MAEQDSIRIMLLGKTGSGKSSLANTILGGQNEFEVCHGSIKGTKECKSVTKSVHGRRLQLFDTPGVFDTDLTKPDIDSELLRGIIDCTPGPHALLVVMKVQRFTKQEQATMELIIDHFSEEALKYTTLVFTQGEELYGRTIEEWLGENEALYKLVQRFGGRCHVFDNRYWNNSQDPYRNNQYQIEQLLETIDQIVAKNGGRCYTNKTLQNINDDHLAPS